MTDEIRLPQSMQNIGHRVLHATSNSTDYDVWTWEPPGHDPSGPASPLLVLLDGDMFMGAAIDTIAILSSIGEARPAIVAGVSTAPPGVHMIQRSIDYSSEVPTQEMRAPPDGASFSFWDMYERLFQSAGMTFADGFGGTDSFLAFLTDQLLPTLCAQYNIDPAEIGIAGHSSGGDFAVDTLLRKDTPFSKFIVGSFGTDVLQASLAAREARFAQHAIDRHLRVFCGYGGAEREDPYLKAYINRGVDLLERMRASDPEHVHVSIRGFDKETHGSVFAHIFSSGYRELWGTNVSFVEAMAETL